MNLKVQPSQLICSDVCAWPNLKKFDNGELMLLFHNEASHVVNEGELDLLFSTDNGHSWGQRQTVFHHQPGTCRTNHAAGISGDRVVMLCSGWKLFRERLLIPASMISRDRGKTWESYAETPGLSPLTWVAFGNIVQADNGDLCVAAYLNLNGLVESCFIRSCDQGVSWKTIARIADRCNETDIAHLGGGHWIAVVRTEDRGILQYDSVDDGRSWHFIRQLTRPRQVTGNLCRFSDSRLIFSFGDRTEGNFGVRAMISENNGKSWSNAFELVKTQSGDCGYPSSVQLNNGEILTAYYTKTDESYELRSVRWQI